VTLADFGYLFRLLGFHAHKTVKLIFIVHEFNMRHYLGYIIGVIVV
jgi:hypothetical protein